MKYIIFANNIDLKYCKNNIYQLLNSEDIVVTLNHALPMSTILQNNMGINIWHFSRRSFNKKIPYSGLEILDNYKHIFRQIFLYPHPEAIGNTTTANYVKKYIRDNTTFSISDFYHMPGFSKNDNVQQTRFFLSQRYNKITNLSTGLVAYLHIKNTKQINDKIYLVGFTHQMNTNKHNSQAEKDFFLQEQDNDLCQTIELKL